MPVARARAGEGRAVRSWWRALLVGLAVTALPLGGCGAAAVSQIEQGEAVNSGKASFDSYFGWVLSFHRKVEALDSNMFPIRQPLTERFALPDDISLPELIAAVRKRAQALRDHGIRLNLRLTPSIALLTSVEDEKKKVAAADKDALAALNKSAGQAMGDYQQYVELLNRAAELTTEGRELSKQLDEQATGEQAEGENDEKRQSLVVELAGAQRLLDRAQTKLRRDSRTLALYLVELALALDTGATSNEVAELKKALKECKKRPKRRWVGRPGPRQPVTDEFEM